ncbi:hypothetical protein KL86PLE_100229 [uncultured Pleomorphomonas sp.]|uniref:Fibronectin type-III domain-containing protein n=1 Tax=uncultured Pleomorphomonas sp. TaxID=442121 RepID=A0A212L1W7_9HYPH|nr:phage tail protein [uncultured Pleomorphomonas sp.]SCM71477.1 hypothetical protein KL86PLE_100229 [uncultured Pleomorphomonas sp.]
MNAPVRLRGAGGGGKASGSNDKNSLLANSTARVLFALAEGPIKGVVGGLQGVYIDDTRVENASGEKAFDGVTHYERLGYPTQDPIGAFDGVSTVIAVGAEVKHAYPVTRNLTNDEFTSCVVTIRIPALVKSKDDGLKKTSVSFRIEVMYDGGAWVNPFGADLTISGKCTSAYDKQYSFQLPQNPSGESAPWSVRVTRLTSDSNDDDLQNSTYFASLTGIIDVKMIYPDTALFGLAFDAEDFEQSGVPTVEVIADGLLLQVPSNYDPETRSYSGVWDGTFKTAFSDNPAWFYWTVATNKRFGAGKLVDLSAVDKWALYAIAQICDEMVDDGYGDTEPRFAVNAYITEAQNLYDMMQLIASAFRGMSYWGSGAVTATQDVLSDPVALVTRANVIDGEITYASSSLSARHTVVHVKYKDKKDDYRDTVEVVRDEDAILRYGERVKEVDGFGCTSRAAARRLGQWILLTELFETQTATYQAGLDHAMRRPGEIVSIMDPEISSVDYGGRLGAGSTASSLILDRPVVLEAGKTYTIHVTMPDGTLASREVVNAATAVSTLALATDLDGVPLNAAIWVLASSSIEPKPYRIVAVVEKEPTIFEVTALEVYIPKYALIDDVGSFDLPNYASTDFSPPTNISVREYLYLTSAKTVRSAATVGWTPSADTRIDTYEVQYREQDGDWLPAGTTRFSYLDVLDLDQGAYQFRVRGYSATTTRRSVWLTSTAILLLGADTVPGDVSGFGISVLGDISTLSWSAVTSLNLDHYVIRYSPNTEGVTWGSAAVLLSHVTSTSAQVPTQAGTYLIKAATASDIESANAALIVTTIPGSYRNVVDTFEEAPAWPGEMEDVYAANGALRLGSADTLDDWTTLSEVFSLAYGINGLALSGIYTSAETLDLGDVYTSRLTPAIKAFGENVNNVMSTWATLAEVETLAGTDPSSWSVEMQIRTTNDDPADSPGWSDWVTATVGDVSARAYQMRLRLGSAYRYVTPIVTAATLTVDMPDRIISGNDLSVPIDGLRIDFSPGLKKLTGLSISAQGLETGDYYTITEKDEAGFDILFKDAANTAVARTFDYVATGYGRGAT